MMKMSSSSSSSIPQLQVEQEASADDAANVIEPQTENTTTMTTTDDDDISPEEKSEADADADAEAEAASIENGTRTSNISLKFDNFTDLQTRLVLLPYNDDECIGAVVHSYTSRPKPRPRVRSKVRTKDGHAKNDAHVYANANADIGTRRTEANQTELKVTDQNKIESESVTASASASVSVSVSLGNGSCGESSEETCNDNDEDEDDDEVKEKEKKKIDTCSVENAKEENPTNNDEDKDTSNSSDTGTSNQDVNIVVEENESETRQRQRQRQCQESGEKSEQRANGDEIKDEAAQNDADADAGQSSSDKDTNNTSNAEAKVEEPQSKPIEGSEGKIEVPENDDVDVDVDQSSSDEDAHAHTTTNNADADADAADVEVNNRADGSLSDDVGGQDESNAELESCNTKEDDDHEVVQENNDSGMEEPKHNIHIEDDGINAEDEGSTSSRSEYENSKGNDNDEEVYVNQTQTERIKNDVKLQPDLVKDDVVGSNDASEVGDVDMDVDVDVNPEGYILVGMFRVNGASITRTPNQDLRTEEFASIFATIREAKTPVVLEFEKPVPSPVAAEAEGVNIGKEGTYNYDEDNATWSTASSNTGESEDQNGDNDNDNETGKATNMPKGRWQKWGGEAAARARNAMIAGKELAEKKMQNNQDGTSSGTGQNEEVHQEVSNEMPVQMQMQMEDQEQPFCGIFLQTSSGKCISLQAPSSRRQIDTIFQKNPPPITNTSVLVIRISLTRPCPTLGYRYQWYRSKKCEAESDGVKDWIALEGAISVVYQPSTTDVGFRLKCIVENCEPGTPNRMMTCEILSSIQSDKVLFDTAKKQFRLLHDAGETFVSSFDNMSGREEFKGAKIRLELYTNQNRTEGRQFGFFMTVSILSDTCVQDPDERITFVSARTYCNKAKSFYLKYWSAQNTEERILKLKAPSRLARETFLTALGIASFEGLAQNLTIETVLFPEQPEIQENKCGEGEDIPSKAAVPATEPDAKSQAEEKKEDSVYCLLNRPVTPELKPDSSFNSVTPGKTNTKMMAIENELEQDMTALHDRLESRNKEVNCLRTEIEQLRNRNRKLEEEKSKSAMSITTLEEEHKITKKNLLISERRIQSRKSDISRLKEDQVKYSDEYKNGIKKYEDAAADFDKQIKSLQNEKAVLSAAVEARDNRLNRMSALKDIVVGLQQKVKESKNLQGEVNALSSKNESLLETIEGMKTMDEKLKENNSNLESINTKAKIALTKEKKLSVSTKIDLEKMKGQFQAFKSERNRWKQKAESLAKEMSRICRNGKCIGDIEKLMYDNDKISSEVSILRSEKKKAIQELEESRITYVTYVQAQEIAGVNGEAVRAIQKCTELERVITNMTEYLDAKETQLQSIQEANMALTEELRKIHQLGLSDNDV